MDCGFLRKNIRLIAFLAPFIFLPILSGCSNSVPDLIDNHPKKLLSDAMETGSRKLIGLEATDCGRVQISQSPELANDCALAAFKSGKSFRVRYDLRGIDSVVSEGLLRASDGKIYKMTFDGDPMGGGGISPTRQRFLTIPCPEPVKMRLTEDRHLDCFPPSNPQSPKFSTY